MGIFDDFFKPLIEPLKEVSETLQQVKDDTISSIGQVKSEVSDLKDQGTTAISDLKTTIKGDGSQNDSSSQE